MERYGWTSCFFTIFEIDLLSYSESRICCKKKKKEKKLNFIKEYKAKAKESYPQRESLSVVYIFLYFTYKYVLYTRFLSHTHIHSFK